jgi:purine-binding chemotaxis protein CheW
MGAFMSGASIDWAGIRVRMAAAEAAISRAGRASREETDVVLKARAACLAREAEDVASGTTLEVLAFMLGQEKYGIETTYVREVTPLNDLTPLPGSPPFLMGIVNIRGQVLSVTDVRRLFDLPEWGVGDQDRIIVLQHGEMEFGILGNSILGVVQVATADLHPGLPTLSGAGADILKGITGDRMAVLDGARLLADEKLIVRDEA